MEELIKPEPRVFFAFDKKKDKIDYLFDKKEINKANELIKNKKILFNERINKNSYSIVDDKVKYLTVIIYDDLNKEINLSCNCGSNKFCSHLYASYLEENEKKFYKVAYKDDSKSLIDKLRHFEYFLCPDIDGDDFIVISNNQLIRIPILNNDGSISLDIIEDDDKKSLEKKLNKYLKDKK